MTMIMLTKLCPSFNAYHDEITVERQYTGKIYH